ncbi:MAG: hypothetical protein ACYCY1_11475 [Sulfuriferula sp.]
MKTDDEISMLKTNATRTGQVLTVTPTPRLELSTIDAVRREMARLYREAKAGNIPTADASRLAFILGQVGKLIEIGTLEARLNALENDL